ncbi:MAG: hypothetical protein ACFCU3_08660 [Verrucomicrobiales bacterium]
MNALEGELVILCPDSAWPQALDAILARPKSLGIRPIRWRCVPDPLHDSSPESAELLRPFLGAYTHAMVIKDFEGSGWEERGVQAFHDSILQQMVSTGWDRSACQVLIAEPELESWLRLDSTHMHRLLEERARKNRAALAEWKTHLRTALERNGGTHANGKAVRPKEVLREVLSVYAIPPANALFAFLAGRESLKGCTVESFQQFVSFLRDHFPEEQD